jgi:hypothetical protein
MNIHERITRGMACARILLPLIVLVGTGCGSPSGTDAGSAVDASSDTSLNADDAGTLDATITADGSLDGGPDAAHVVPAWRPGCDPCWRSGGSCVVV